MGLESDRERLELYRQAEANILQNGQSSTSNGRTWTLADLGKIQAEITRLENRIVANEGGPIVMGRPERGGP
jgi:hypothetical protein